MFALRQFVQEHSSIARFQRAVFAEHSFSLQLRQRVDDGESVLIRARMTRLQRKIENLSLARRASDLGSRSDDDDDSFIGVDDDAYDDDYGVDDDAADDDYGIGVGDAVYEGDFE